jgi:hypothetical protein
LATVGDGLPALLAPLGPWGVLQGYQPRTPAERSVGQLYVLRQRIREKRFANQRRMAKYEFLLRLVWPLNSGIGNAEEDQAAFDAAVDLVLLRVGGFRGDKSHGGRFLSVGEDPDEVDVRFDPPAATLTADATLRAEITYWADDFEITG